MSLGEQLRAARTAAAMTVDDVAAATRMRASVLAALEDDDLAVLGPEVYARGHLRTIATVIGLDPDAVLEQYAAQAEASNPEAIP